LQYLSNIAFEWEAWKRFRGRLRAREFDVVHRVTPLSPTLGSPMARWSPVPFVIGPINGGLPWPKAFRAELAREKEWLSYVRGVAKLLPYYRSTYRRAAAVLAGFQHTIDFLPRSARDRCFVCSDVGYEDRLPEVLPPRPANPVMTVAFVGRLVPYKCPDVLVRAFAASPLLRRHRLLIIGDGPERGLLQQIVAEQGLEACVEFTGWLSHEEVQRRLQAADVFGFPSIRELGAGAVIEAMGLGLPCVVADYGGPGVYAAGGRGIAVPMTDKAALTAGFQRALETLAADPDQRQRLGEAAHNYVKALHTWDAKARKIRQVYDWVLGRRAERPDFNALP
jgi:glycosyltransferase involved in cell wall biosynthesis